jgi:hypothetical protein
MSITDIARVLIGGVRLLGPFLVLLAVLALLAEAASRPGRARLRLAHLGLSEARPSRIRRILVGTLVPTLGVVALSVSLSLEQEVREGPNRMVDRLQAHAGAYQPAWILQRGSSHFMNDSRLPGSVLQAAVADRSGAAHALWEQLVTVKAEGKSADTGLLLGIPSDDLNSPFSPDVQARTARCTVTAGTCRLGAGEAIADASVYPVGTRLRVRDSDLLVIANTATPYSLINRTVVFTDRSAFSRADGTLDDPYAVVVGGPEATAHARAIVASTSRGDTVEVDSGASIKRANATFWAGNGTPLLLLVICLSGAFCGVALYAARRALQERERMSMGTLQALGLRVSQVCRIDLLRALLGTAVAAVLSVPLTIVLIKVVDAGMLGFHATLTPLLVLAAAGLLIFANLLGTAAMYVRTRDLSVVEAISQP